MDAVTIAVGASCPAIAVTAEGVILACSPAAEEYFGYREAPGQRLQELLSARDAANNRWSARSIPFWDMVAASEPVGPWELRVRRASGESALVTVSTVVVLGPRAGEYDLVHFFQPIERNEALLSGQYDWQGLDIQGRLRIGNTIRKNTKVAAAHGEPVCEALLAGVTHPIFGRVDTGWIWRQPTFRHLGTNLFQGYIRQWSGASHALVQKPLPLFG